MILVPAVSLRSMRSHDHTDLRLLLALVADPRGTVVAFAQRLGLSRNTVQARLASLEKRALLPFDRRIDPAAMGYHLTAFITVHVHQPRLPSIVTELTRIPEVVEGYGLSGAADVLLRVVAKDAQDLFRVNGLVLAVPGVER